MARDRNDLHIPIFLGLIFVILTAIAVETKGNDGKIFACYYQRSRRVPISAIPADLCTHIIFAFGEATKNGIIPVSSSDVTAYSALIGLKSKNPDLKVLLSLQKGFPAVVDGGQTVMQTFTKNAIAYLRKYGFDGVDFDWEFPSKTQKDGFMKLISIFRQTVNAEAEVNGLSSVNTLLISMALSNNRFIAARSYDIPSLDKYIDFATIMTYDFHVYNAKYDNLTGYNSPLNSPKGEGQFASVSGMIKYYVNAGLDSKKTLMGMPTYGRTYTLADASNHGLHAPASGKGAGGPVIDATGVYITMEICMILKTPGVNSVMDHQAGVPYLYKGKTWITYDNIDSFNIKCKWAQQNDLGGMGVWSIPLDDISNTCAGGPFPMLKAIKSCWK